MVNKSDFFNSEKTLKSFSLAVIAILIFILSHFVCFNHHLLRTLTFTELACVPQRAVQRNTVSNTLDRITLCRLRKNVRLTTVVMSGCDSEISVLKEPHAVAS